MVNRMEISFSFSTISEEWVGVDETPLNDSLLGISLPTVCVTMLTVISHCEFSFSCCSFSPFLQSPLLLLRLVGGGGCDSERSRRILRHGVVAQINGAHHLR